MKGLSLTISFEKRECFIFEKLFSNGAALFLQAKKESILIYKSSRSLYFCCLLDPTCDKSVKGQNKGQLFRENEKILENTYRNINIGLVNELTMLCDRIGISMWEVIDAAKTKPYGFQAFYPGPGLGGHCIPLDPYYLTWKAREYGFHTSMIEGSMIINDQMPEYCRARKQGSESS